jgi:hypothetical protein
VQGEAKLDVTLKGLTFMRFSHTRGRINHALTDFPQVKWDQLTVAVFFRSNQAILTGGAFVLILPLCTARILGLKARDRPIPWEKSLDLVAK